MRELISKNGKSAEEFLKPGLPLELAKWIESNEISSANLRNNLWQNEKVVQESASNVENNGRAENSNPAIEKNLLLQTLVPEKGNLMSDV